MPERQTEDPSQNEPDVPFSGGDDDSDAADAPPGLPAKDNDSPVGDTDQVSQDPA